MTQLERRSALSLKAPSLLRFSIVALLVPLVLVALLLWLRTEYDRSEQMRMQAAHSFDRRVDQITLLSRLKDAETAQRGFLLTGNPTFLRPYDPAKRAIQHQIAQGLAAQDGDVPHAYWPVVSRLAGTKLAELDRTIALYRAGDAVAARGIVAQGSGKRLMDQLRDVVGHMISAEQMRSEQSRAAYGAYNAQLQNVAFATVVALVLVVLAGLTFLWRSRRQRHASLVEAFEAAERHATILDSTIDAILILNPSGTVETMNAAATRMLGYTPAELARRDIATVIDLAPGDGSFHKRIGLVDGQLRRSFLPDQTIRRGDGRDVAVDVAIGVMFVPSGDHLVVSLRDISERKRLERIKDDLMSTVSHELRTPLTSIVGSLGLLRAGAAGAIPADAGRLIEIAENNSRRLIRLINDMLDIDRIQSGKLDIARTPANLASVIEQACVGSEGLAATKQIVLNCSKPKRPVMIRGDADRLLQVTTNLLSNAIRAAPSGSIIDLGLTDDDDRAVVSVEDRGPGIPAGFRDRIFGRFERGDPADGSVGTGLGLAISREIVTRHGGTIWFEDRAGGGTRFAFAVALIGASQPIDASAPAVLICEANETVAGELIAIAAAEGCGYELARSSNEARAALARRAFTVLLVGLTLPEEGGLAFAQGARDGDPPVDAPIIIVAAASGDDNGRSALDVVDWIEKPGDPARLSVALRTALSRKASRKPVILHLDDDRDLLEVVAAAIEPEAQMVSATDLPSARALLQRVSPDVAILDLKLADGSGLDLIPFLIDEDGLAIPTIIYSAQDITSDMARKVDAVLVKARGSMPDLKATIRRVIRSRDDTA